MSESKHSPGPWKYNGLSCIHAKNIYGEPDIVAHIADDDCESVYCRSEEEAIANAHLIAAAPDLLSIVREVSRIATKVVRVSDQAVALERLDPAIAAVLARVDLYG